MIEITCLADHLDVIPTLSQWFRTQWPDHYAERSPADVAQDFVAEANHNRIPVRLVAFVDGALAGTITLRAEAAWTLPEYQPGLGGLFVTEQYRSRGIATELVKAGMKVAQEQGYESVYATTVAARGILERLGWKLVKGFWHGDEKQLLYQYEF